MHYTPLTYTHTRSFKALKKCEKRKNPFPFHRHSSTLASNYIKKITRNSAQLQLLVELNWIYRPSSPHRLCLCVGVSLAVGSRGWGKGVKKNEQAKKRKLKCFIARVRRVSYVWAPTRDLHYASVLLEKLARTHKLDVPPTPYTLQPINLNVQLPSQLDSLRCLMCCTAWK